MRSSFDVSKRLQFHEDFYDNDSTEIQKQKRQSQRANTSLGFAEPVLESPYDTYLQDAIGGHQLLYKAKVCDDIDWMMAKFLNSDPTGKNLKLPVIRLEKGVYLIGLCKWEVKLNDQFRLVVKGAKTWSSFKQMMMHTSTLQMDALEDLMHETGKSRDQVIIDKLYQLKASERVISNFRQRLSFECKLN